jgi:RNA polymerase sigma-70 factor (ECF subfamily)
LPLTDESSPETETDRRTVIGRVRAAVAALPAGQRQVITLVDLEGLSYVEVANVLKVPMGTVMSRLCRARRALRKTLLDTTEGPDAATQAGLRRAARPGGCRAHLCADAARSRAHPARL